jgi:alanine racemase
VFLALRGRHADGHQFLAAARAGGCVAAVVAEGTAAPEGTPALVAVPPTPGDDDPVLAALMRLAAWWRGQLRGTVVGITGSNGKTTVKTMLQAVLGPTRRTASSPGSYNSRLGVALSLLGMDEATDVCLVEAGVSAPGDMASLAAMIRPARGLLTNVGLAHLGSFGARERIADEKLRLFDPIGADGWVLLPEDPLCRAAGSRLHARVLHFGRETPADGLPGVTRRSTTRRLGQVLTLAFDGGPRLDVEVGDTSAAQGMNVAAVASTAVLLGVTPADIADRLDGFRPPAQRLETWQTPDGVTVINDCYSADPTSTDAALRALGAYPPGHRKIFVFGGMAGLGAQHAAQHRHVGELAAEVGVSVLAPAGPLAEPAAQAFGERARSGVVLGPSGPDALAEDLPRMLRHGDVVLVKGPTDLRLDGLARALVASSATTRFLVDLTVVEANLRRIRQVVGPGPKICPIVKAEAYGGDSIRLGRHLERVGVDYLGVAFADEGVALRKAGITLPVLVLSAGRGDAEVLVRWQLTPVVHSADGIPELEEAAARHGLRVAVHVKVDTGMGRYGFFPAEVPAAVRRLGRTPHLELGGLMTHFAVADDPAEDAFTRQQIATFAAVVEALVAEGLSVPIRHAAATAAALRFPEARLDMVRIGLGLYGVSPSPACAGVVTLECAVAAVSRITSIKRFPAGHTLGYGRRYRVPEPGRRIAFIPCGYHDAVWRDLHRGGGEVLVRGVRCPIVGTVSMDSAPIDVTAVPDADVGDDVLLFGEYQGHRLPPEEIAERAGTVAHELLSGIGPRVQRIYLEG